MLRRHGLDHGAARVRTAPGTADDLRNERKRCLGGTEIVYIQAHVRVNDADERDGWEIKALGNHLRAKQNGNLLFAEFFQHCLMPACGGYGIGVHAQNLRVGKQGFQFLLDLLRAASDGLHRTAAFFTARMCGHGKAAVVAHQTAAGGVVRQMDAAPRALRHVTAIHADQIPAVAAPVQKQDGLFTVQNCVADALFQFPAQVQIIARAKFLLHVDDTRVGQRASIVAGLKRIKAVNTCFGQIHRLDGRRGRAEKHECARPRAAIERDLPRVIARGVFRFICMLLLLIEDKQTGVLKRCEDR